MLLYYLFTKCRIKIWKLKIFFETNKSPIIAKKKATELFMSAATKKKHVFLETINNFDLPTEKQKIVKVKFFFQNHVFYNHKIRLKNVQ